MTKSLLSTLPNGDPGSHAASGYSYQWHLATARCIEMLQDPDTQYVVCEFHEDVVEVRFGEQLDLIQIKKRDTGKWSLANLLSPAKRDRPGILAGLFAKLQAGKDIRRLTLLGN